MNHSLITPVILAGGSGERLWPLSRTDIPKQLLPLLGDSSLLQDTVARVSDPACFTEPLILCSDTIRFTVAEQLRQTPCRIILEPVSRNTAPAIAAAALMLHAQSPDALMLVTPADLAITRHENFEQMLARGADAATQGKIVIFGMTPDTPHTGYGYIRCGAPMHGGAFHVASFTEKPDAVTAASYLASGEYSWNSGMFLMSAATCIREFELHAPELLRHARRALGQATADRDFLRLKEKHFAACPALSIDHAIMEKTSQATVVRAEIGWSDLGTWDAVWQMAAKDAHNNVTCGDVLLQDCTSSYVRSEHGLLACIGLQDIVAVQTGDATLIAPAARISDLKTLTQELKKQRRPEIAGNKTVSRPWGTYTALVNQPGFQVKRILVKRGGKLSLQSHGQRSEHWVVVHGNARVTCNDRIFELRQNESTFIPAGAKHRLENAGEDTLEIIEIQVGSYLGEDDIVRYDDIYQRHLIPA